MATAAATSCASRPEPVARSLYAGGNALSARGFPGSAAARQGRPEKHDVDRANRLRKSGRYARARVALAAAPDDPVVALRSVSIIRRVDVAAARELLEASKLGLQGRGSLHDAFRPDIDYADGLLACDEGRIDAGIAHFEAAFAAEPDGIGYGADLALAYLDVGRKRKALDVIARALEHQPGNERLLEAAGGS